MNIDTNLPGEIDFGSIAAKCLRPPVDMGKWCPRSDFFPYPYDSDLL